MPPIFKALTTINAWFLFILGWLFFAVYVQVLVTEGRADWIRLSALCGLFVACFTLSSVVMKIRKNLE